MTNIQKSGVAILGIFAVDVTFLAPRLPAIGETLAGSGFILGPGGKGSNQAVAAARAGGEVRFITKIGKDAFGDIGLKTWAEAGATPHVQRIDSHPTGSAFIFVNDHNGQNAIIVYAGASGTLTPADLDLEAATIAASKVFVTQLEQPVDAAVRGLQIARAAGTITVFNPAPAMAFPDEVYGLSDYIAPNETEAAMLTGIAPGTVDDARKAGDALLEKGARNALITLGGNGVLLHNAERSVHLPARAAGEVIDTTGAGDAFLGGFAAALSKGLDPVEAARYGSATAGISVTRRGAAASMPTAAEIEAFLAS
ncbi:ribokinase [Pleomorphomonas koreensis]|uniref:ribokinase n=1 Tax=Pleomorphomonas koreensis TaxID=257440 RepID=UPI000406BB33|nr:ribokinase [Pleomorphomonas koreensis]